jgi:hypothetical protein
MEHENSGSVATKILSFLFFVILTIASFWWFIVSSYNTLHSVFYGEEVVLFSKGAMYSLGAGIILLLLTLLGVYQNIKKIDLSIAQTKWATRIFILATVSMFIFPIVAHFTVSKLTAKKGYFECKEMNYQWLLYKKLVYTTNEHACEALIQEKEITKSSSGR